MRPDRVILGLLLLAMALALSACAGGPGTGTPRSHSGETSAIAQRAILRAQSLLAQGDAQTALDHSQEALRVSPRSARVRVMHGNVLEALGRSREAGEHFLRAYTLDPKSGPVLNAYGAWLCRLGGRVDDALEAFSNATLDANYRTPAQALANAGSCAADAGREATAEMNFRAALELAPTNAHALFGLSKLELHRGKLLNARAFFQRREALGSLGPAEVALAIEIETAAGDTRATAYYRRQLAAMAARLEAAPSPSTTRSPQQ